MKRTLILCVLLCSSLMARAHSWPQHEVDMRGYVIKIKHLEEDRDNLLKEKAFTRDNARMDEIIKELNKVYKEIEKAYMEFNREKEHIRFEHPEQGDIMERKYRRVRMKTLEERESELGLNGKLNVMKYKLEQTYNKNYKPSKPSHSPEPSPMASPKSDSSPKE
jgi:hypothetical protein